MGRLAVMAHFDVHGQVAPHVARHVEALAAATDQLIVVSTASLTDQARAWLQARARLIVRPNYGYDFFSWRTGLMSVPDLPRFSEVIICNDSYIGPLVPYSCIFDHMAAKPVDFWGLTTSQRVAFHVQSFFVAFRPWLVRSQAFRGFWSGLVPTSDRREVILRQEVGLSREFISAGFTCGAYFEACEDDVKLARERVRWWAAHRQVKGHRRPPAHVVEARSAEAWNPAIALADRALERRLPYVKIDTLRYDPYGLGASRLLSKCERAMPAHFDGVRSYLQRTAPHYPMRPEERLTSSPSRQRPSRRRVKY